MRKLLLCAAVPALAAAAVAGPPATPKRPVTDAYHGVAVRDDYRWLEDGSDPEVRRWSDAQNAYTRSVLDRLPSRGAIARRMRELLGSESPEYFPFAHRGGLLFALKSQPPKQHPFLVTLRSVDDLSSERVLADPNLLDRKGATSIDWAVPSLDGKLVAVSLSEGGSENGSVRVFEASGRQLPDVVPRVNGGTAGGGLAWNADATGFFYTRYPRAGERPPEDMDFYQQVWFHRLGTPTAQDVYSIGKEFPRIAETELRSSEDGRSILAVTKNGDGQEKAISLRTPAGEWVTLAGYAERVADARFGPDGSLYLLSHKDASRGRILRLPPGSTSLAAAAVAVPQGDAVIETFLPTAARLWVVELVGGPGRLRVFERDGRVRELPILPVSSVSGLVRLSGEEVLYANESFLQPRAWYRAAPDGAPARTALVKRPAADFSDAEVLRETATSKDGTKVPLTILRRRGTRLDGRNPTLLTGYGGYGIGQSPHYSDGRRVWIEQGGALAVANLRGGDEFGEDWHRAGNLTRKQNVFDDFLACAQFLLQAGYATPRTLAIEGASNGGLLMGAAFTQRPDLFRAVVSHVGIYDMLRVERSPNGAFNVTEFGTVKDPDQFRALYAYSPYHRVVERTPYPAILFLTGANDPRVDPMQSRKMTARLQAARGSDAPVLLRTSSGSGHGFGTALDETIAQATDVWSFLFWQLGVGSRPVGGSPWR